MLIQFCYASTRQQTIYLKIEITHWKKKKRKETFAINIKNITID